jgi:tetratricopeptide (TPR) repeat protein
VAQLIDAETDAHVWAETFDRDLTDVFAVQTEVSERIAAGLRTRLAPNERRRIAKAPTTDPEAYNLYLLARHHANLATADGFTRAADFYQRAVERDPLFARAWAAQAFAHFFHLAGYYGVRPRDAAPKVVQLATRALEIDPDIAEAHMMLGYVAELIDLDCETDRARKERALNLSPNLADAHLGYGNCLVIAGRYDEAIEEARIALELDPASEYVHVHANWLRYQTRRFDLALPAVEAAEAPAVESAASAATPAAMGDEAEVPVKYWL